MKRIMHVILFLLLAALAIGLLAGCSALPKSLTGAQPTATTAPVKASSNVTAEGHVVPRDSTSLFFSTGGRVSEVIVKEGDKVSKGAVLARLGDRESVQASVASAQLELTSAQQQLDSLNREANLAYTQALQASLVADKALIEAQQKLTEIDTDEHQRRIDDANTAVSNAKDDLKSAQEEVDKYANLDPDNTIRKNADDDLKAAQTKYDQEVQRRDLLVNELDMGKAAVEAARANQAEAARVWDNRKSGPDPEQLALAQARLANAQAQLTAAQATLARMDLTAPYDGTVVEIHISVGEQAFPNQPVIVLADLSTWYVETSDLTENEVVKLETGKAAQIVPDALPETTLSGKIEQISNNYNEKAGDINYTVRILLSDSDPLLRWGMTVNVTFEP